MAPRDTLDDDLAAALADVKSGRVYGPFSSGAELARSIRESEPRTKQ